MKKLYYSFVIVAIALLALFIIDPLSTAQNRSEILNGTGSQLTNLPLTGPLTNGFTHTGSFQVGGADTWTIPGVAVNDSIVVRLGKVRVGGPDPNFFPRLRVVGPNGVPVGDVFSGNINSNAAEVETRAVLAGTYTVLVSQNPNLTQIGPANYILTMARTPGSYVISSGDEGTEMISGATHTGLSTIGDLDIWTIPAVAVNDNLTVRLGEVTVGGSDPGFRPRLRVIRPDGIFLGDDVQDNAAEVSARAPVAGIYTVLVSQDPNFVQGETSNYALTLARIPGQSIISPGDQGGQLTNGSTHTGVMAVGDIDIWTFSAAFHDSMTIRAGAAAGGGGTNFRPRIRVIHPDGTTVGDNGQGNSAEVSMRVPLTGTYTVLVSQDPNFTQTGPSNYILTLAETPGPYIVSPDDEGGPIMNEIIHTGEMPVGDLDTWVFHATSGNSISLNLDKLDPVGANSAFSPRLRLLDPEGATLNDVNGSSSAQIIRVVPITGVYTVLVSQDPNLEQFSTASYTLAFDGPEQPTISISNVTQVEGDSGTTPFTFDVVMSSPVTQAVNLKYATAPGTASTSIDFTPIPLTQLTFDPGEVSKTITVAVNGDISVEGTETFFLNFTDAFNVTLVTPTATGSIRDDDNVVSGKVTTPDGTGLRNAVVSLTDPLGSRRTATTSSFGVYTFDNVVSGATYLVTVSSKRFRFAPRSQVVNGALSDVDFVGLE